ncbi:MAG: MFS transporter [Rhodospirillaceae bacterium]|nr:MFS transporter [Rhodospirillaceae bacterium]
MVSPLSNKVYRTLFLAQVISLLGTGLSTIALALLAFELAGNEAGKVLGIALALKMVAYVFVAPVIGAFADKFSRRKLLINLDLGRAILILFLPFVNEIWQIYLIIFILNSFSAGFTPIFQATIPDILTDKGQYTRALSLSRLAYDLENLSSPIIAALLLTILSYNVLFVSNMIAFLISAILIFSVKLPSPKLYARERGIWQNTSFGIRAYLKTPRLRGLLALSLAVASAGAMVIVNTVVFVRDQLSRSESDTALAYAAVGVGSIIVALLLPKLLERFTERFFMISGGFVLALSLLMGMNEPNFVYLLILWFCIGFGSSLILTHSGRLLLSSATEGGRPAIYAAQFALSHACWLFAYIFAGWVGFTFGLSAAFLLLFLVTVLSTLLALFTWPANDPKDIEHLHSYLCHSHLHITDEHHTHDHEGWEGPEPHEHAHVHEEQRHSHHYVIDIHHPRWPSN